MNVNSIIVQFLGNLAPTISIKFCKERSAGLFRKPRSGSLLLEFFLTIANPLLLFPLIGGSFLAVVLHRIVLILYSVSGNTLPCSEHDPETL